MSLLELRTTNLPEIEKELTSKVNAAPSFFKNNPVVLSFEHCEGNKNMDLNALITLCAMLGLIITGIKGGNDALNREASMLGFATFPAGKKKQNPDNNHAKANTVNINRHESTRMAPAKIVETPIRSGQQVYSTGDLIIMSSVSAGAEVLAEGSIHVYGTLRGRALSGIKGLETARIFCLRHEAELLSIAGHFMIDEELRSSHWGEPVQALFDGSDLLIQKMNN